jgi:hypothetical protein
MRGLASDAKLRQLQSNSKGPNLLSLKGDFPADELTLIPRRADDIIALDRFRFPD